MRQHLLSVIASFEGRYRGMTVPKRPSRDFEIVLDWDFGGELHDLARAYDEWEGGKVAAVEALLSMIEFAEVEVEGRPELVEQTRRLRGAVMLAATNSAEGRDARPDPTIPERPEGASCHFMPPRNGSVPSRVLTKVTYTHGPMQCMTWMAGGLD